MVIYLNIDCEKWTEKTVREEESEDGFNRSLCYILQHNCHQDHHHRAKEDFSFDFTLRKMHYQRNLVLRLIYESDFSSLFEYFARFTQVKISIFWWYLELKPIFCKFSAQSQISSKKQFVLKVRNSLMIDVKADFIVLNFQESTH